MFNIPGRLPLAGLWGAVSLVSILWVNHAFAQEAPKESVQQPAIAPQVENLKESVLTLNRDLLILEEELLYPPSNQIAVYVSMDLGQFFSLDAVKFEIDNKLVASELYTDKQVSALFRGGVQRLY
ncbi:MAG: AraC family transcriptional regulator, partial [Moraxellaceae bacterium]